MRNYIVLFFVVGNGLLFSQPGALPGQPPVDVQAAISRAGRGGIESLVAKYPTDFWAQRAYIDAMASEGGARVRGGSGIVGGRVDEPVIARFKQGYDARPGGPEAAYLYAYSLINRETSKTVEILTSVTQKTPSFPTAWMTLAILHGYAKSFVDGFSRPIPIPTTWTSDVMGTIRLEALGFGGDGSQWVTQKREYSRPPRPGLRGAEMNAVDSRVGGAGL